MPDRLAPLRLGLRLIALALIVHCRAVHGLAQPAIDPGKPSTALAPRAAPLTPAQALTAFQLEPGLRIELVASEPMIESPVALAFDERGRLYVAENRGYPTGPGPGKPPAGRIALLLDTDGDGRMDRRVDFADGLTYPNGVMPWRGGVIVTCAPEVLFLRDTNGDGRADERRVLFKGFATSGSTQLRVSHPTLSIDNWIYLTSGLTGGRVTAPTEPGRAPVVLGRTDFRFRPDGQEWEAADGGAQYGQTFDEFGRRFICYNRVHVQHVVIASRALRRNPNFAFSETVENCPAEMMPEPLKGHGSAARLFPISRNVTTADSHAGTFTAACAVTVYRGTGLPASFRGGVFACDPTGNLVHFDRLEPRNATFTARRAREGSEFLASRDDWFRPVFLAHGPDGALYVCDMYRKTIEHPEYLPVEIRKRTDFDSGRTMGRIWRVIRDDVRPDEIRGLRQLDLGIMPTPQLCAMLRNPDAWRCDTAHRLLLERKDPASIRPLGAIVADSTAPPAAVVHALHLLEANAALGDNLIRLALKHGSPPVREHALRRAEPRLAGAARWLADVLPLVDDENARVRFQAAIALGAAGAGVESPPEEGAAAHTHDTVTAALARIAARDGADRWMRAAVFSAIAGREVGIVTALRRRTPRGGTLPTELLGELGRLIGACPAPLRLLGLEAILQGEPQFEPAERACLLTGLAEAARARLGPTVGDDILSALVDIGSERHALSEPLRLLVEFTKRSALDHERPIEERLAAVRLLGVAGYLQAGEVLLRLVDPGEPMVLQVAAVRALGSDRDPRVARSLLAAGRFGAYALSVRDEVVSALFGRVEHLAGVMDAVESGRLPRSVIDAQRRRVLVQNKDPNVRDRAERLFGAVERDRAKVYDDYKDVLKLPANPGNGRTVFRRECASCHRLDQDGHTVGPDLFGIRNQPKPAILLHLLVPDLEITPGFAAYSISTTDGRVLTGLITSETPTSLTLRQPLGKEDTILRAEIEEISAGKQSLMPQGLEKTITRQELADLLAYLKGELGPPIGSVP
jgi:putative membrane-bound dehydrogenase-like protein